MFVWRHVICQPANNVSEENTASIFSKDTTYTLKRVSVYVFETFYFTDQAPCCHNTEFHNISLHIRNNVTFLNCAFFILLNLMTGQHPISFSVSTEAPSMVNRSGRKANHSPPSTVDLKKTRICTFTPTFVFLSCTGRTMRHYFTLSFCLTVKVQRRGMYNTTHKIIIVLLCNAQVVGSARKR
jgi:hypothetical protein